MHREADLAYIAAALDCEGSIILTLRGDNKTVVYPTVVIYNTDMDWLNWIADVLELRTPPRQQLFQGRVCGVLSVHGKEVGRILLMLHPYMKLKQGKAEMAMEALQIPRMSRNPADTGFNEDVKRMRDDLMTRFRGHNANA